MGRWKPGSRVEDENGSPLSRTLDAEGARWPTSMGKVFFHEHPCRRRVGAEGANSPILNEDPYPRRLAAEELKKHSSTDAYSRCSARSRSQQMLIRL